MPDSTDEHWPHIKQQDIESHYSRLGNLALLQAKKNSNIGNMPFSIKRKAYKESTFQLTNQLSEVADWNVEEIENRQKIMAEYAVRAWPL